MTLPCSHCSVLFPTITLWYPHEVPLKSSNQRKNRLNQYSGIVYLALTNVDDELFRLLNLSDCINRVLHIM